MRRLAPSLPVLIALTVPGVAAGAPWSAPRDLGPATNLVTAPSIAFAPAGPGLVTWQVGTGLGNLTAAGSSSRALSLARPAAPVQSVGGSIAAGPVFHFGGRGLVLRTVGLPAVAGRVARQRLAWSAVGRDGRIGRARTIATATLGAAPALAADPRGNAIAAWSESLPARARRGPNGRFRIRAAWRPAGRAFGRPVTLLVTDDLGYTRNGEVAVTVGRAGRAFVAFADNDGSAGRRVRKRLLAWSRTPRRGFGRAKVVGPHSNFASIALAVSPRGRTFVAWGTQDGGEGADTPWIVRVATLAPRGRRFSTPQVLDPGGGRNRPLGGVRIAVESLGRATVAWSGVHRAPQGSSYPVLTALSDAGGRFGRPQQVAPMGALGDLAVREGGAAVLTYARVGALERTDRAEAAVRSARAPRFGPPEVIAPADHAGPPVVAFDPRSELIVAAWPGRPGGPDPALGLAPTAVLRIAARVFPGT